MGKSKAPAPPDPIKTASGQTATNIGTAVANANLQMVDQVTPEGTLSYNQSGTYQYVDPTSGKTYDIPKYTATTALSPEQQATYDLSQQAEQNLAGTAADQSEFLRDYLGAPAEFNTQEIEGRLDELGRQRLDPRFERQEADIRTRLANQGIDPGSEAYAREMDRLAYDRNDAYNNLYLQGRGQAFNELAAKRNQPINEITALLSGSQVSMPNVSPVTPQGAATTDYAGIVNQNYNQRLGAWQQNQQNKNSLMGGLFGAGATILGAPSGSLAGSLFSDRRLKTDVAQIGHNGTLPVYQFRYVWDEPGTERVGYMAQDVIRIKPEAVSYHDGFLAVDYGQLPEVAV